MKKWSICRYFRRLTRFCLFFTQTNTFGLYMASSDVYSAPHSGSVAERLKAPVLKTGDPKGFQSSNLCASARLNKGLPKGSPFVFEAKNKRIFSENIVSFHLNKNSPFPNNRTIQCRADLYRSSSYHFHNADMVRV